MCTSNSKQAIVPVSIHLHGIESICEEREMQAGNSVGGPWVVWFCPSVG